MDEYKKVLSEYDVCIGRAKEFFILKPSCRKNIALSGPRVNMGRLLNALSHHSSLKIFLGSELWTDDELCGNYMTDISDYKNKISENIENAIVLADLAYLFASIASFFVSSNSNKAYSKFELISLSLFLVS